MAISNDWVNVDGLVQESIKDTTDTYTGYYWDSESVEKVASAMGWEVVHLPQNVTLKLAYYSSGSATYEYDSTNIYLIRPIDMENPYPFGLVPFWSGTQSSINGMLIVSLSSGLCIGWLAFGAKSGNHFMILRPYAQGAFALKIFTTSNSVTNYFIFDKFYNPKSGAIRWAGYVSNYVQDIINHKTVRDIVDLSNGYISDETLSSGTHYITIPDGGDFPRYVALKKKSVVATAGVYIARSFYMSYIDYSRAEKTIEIDGDRYRALPTSNYSNYIPLN